MTIKTRACFLMGLLAVTLAAHPTDSTAKATIPFAFEVSGTVLPAGQYRFEYGTNANLLTIRDAAGRVVLAPVRIAESSAAGSPRVTFSRQQAVPRLQEVSVAGLQGQRTLSLR